MVQVLKVSSKVGQSCVASYSAQSPHGLAAYLPCSLARHSEPFASLSKRHLAAAETIYCRQHQPLSLAELGKTCCHCLRQSVGSHRVGTVCSQSVCQTAAVAPTFICRTHLLALCSCCSLHPTAYKSRSIRCEAQETKI